MQGVPAVRSTRLGYLASPPTSSESIVMGRRIATRELSRRAGNLTGMNILLDCAWCEDEVVFTVDETDDELVCTACNTHMAFAPDPATTFRLLYEPAAIAA
jgi:hypothetical protein